MTKRKKRLAEKIFRIVSLAFIIGCVIFYGFRLVKYYKMFNPKKTEKNSGLLSIAIPKNSSIVTTGKGLYHIGGSYIYKGDVDNNYIMFSGMMFRILKINYGSSVEIILDNPVANLAYDNEVVSYDKSNVYDYLNTEFIKLMNKDLLTKSSVCLDKTNDISEKTSKCKKQSKEMYVKLLDINTYLNTISETSYINENDDYIWLSNYNDNMIWHINGYNISTSLPTAFYDVMPVLTLDMDVELIKGTGTIEDPYRIDTKTDYQIGSYVKLGDDSWQIIKKDDKTITLAFEDILSKVMAYGYETEFDKNSSTSLAHYLNTDFYNNLPYKDIILETEYKTGQYIDDYKTSQDQTFKGYVSIPSITDPKISKSAIPYYLINNYDEDEVYTYGNSLSTSKSTLSRGIKPVITINKAELKNGDGTKDAPYALED